MKQLFIIIPTLLFSFSAFAQDEVKAVKADQKIDEVFTVKDLYRYPQFEQAKVYFRDGSVADVKLNYHKYFQQILFIGEKGDSLALGEPETIRVIVINKDSFYLNKDLCVELRGDYKSATLGRRQVLKEVDQQKSGAYGSTYTNNSLTTNKNYYTVDGTPRLNVGESTLFTQTIEYYISYKKSDFVLLTKKNVEKLYAPKSKQIRDFIKENDTDFTNEESLKKLMVFLEQF